MNVSVIVPTLDAAKYWPLFAPALLQCVSPDQVLIVDSQSTDGTVELALSAGFRVHSVLRAHFNHGGTRQMAAEMLPDAEILVYLTQDAVLADPSALVHLVRSFADPQIAVACGRQLPRVGASAIEAHGRIFNYPATSEVRSLESREQRGIKAIFISNSFCAYRRSALFDVGGFPLHVISGEENVAAARLLLAGYKIAYVAEACAYHSHPYAPVQEFKRYFDIGVSHSRASWILDEFGRAGGEGKRYVHSEIRYLLKRNPLLIPSALARTGIKLLGYRLGRIEERLKPGLKIKLSMHPRFWSEPHRIAVAGPMGRNRAPELSLSRSRNQMQSGCVDDPSRTAPSLLQD
jgi:rhamnosyltransferase